MKKNLVLFLLALVLVVSVSLAACNTNEYEIKLDKTSIMLEKGQSVDLPYQLTNKGEIDTETKIVVSIAGDSVTYDETTKKITAVKAGKSTLTITVEGSDVSAKLNVNVPEYTIEITGGATASVNLGDRENLKYTIFKDGTKVSEAEKPVTITATGTAIEYKAVGDLVNFVAEGTGTVKVALKDDPEVYATRTYTVTKSFWSSAHSRFTEAMIFSEDSVEMLGGQQFTLSAMEGGSKYVFKATLKLPLETLKTQQESIGIGSTLDVGDSGLWFGFQWSTSSPGKLSLYIKNFYAGWSNGAQDIHPQEYAAIEFTSDTVDCIVVRDGLNYWYSIGGMIGTYTDDRGAIAADEPTWIGVYSQTLPVTVSNFSYSTSDADIDAAKEICAKPVAFFDVTNKGVNSIVKGDSYQYSTYVVYATNAASKPAIEWELDTTAVTAGTAQIATDGTLTVSEDAAGAVTVTAKCGDKEVTFDVTIFSESLAKENDVVFVNGGVQLGDDGTITFPEERNGNNASLDATQYTDVYYSAKLKAKLNGDFELKFTITNLKPATGASVLVSLGGQNNNFFFSNNSVTINAKYVNTSKEYTSGALTANFTAAETLDVVIKVVGGHYKVTVNTAELNFGGDPIRRAEDYAVDCNALITIKQGTSCVISNLELTNKDNADFILLNSNSVATDDGFKSNIVVYNGWDVKSKSIARAFYTELLPEGDYTISLDVTFNKALADGKLSIYIGDTDFYVNNKIATGVVVGQWHNFQGDTKVTIAVNQTFSVVLKKINNEMYFYINDTKVGDKYNATNLGRVLSFWAGNLGDADAEATAEIANLKVTAGATIISISGESSLQVGSSATYISSVIGSQATPVWSVVTDETLTAGGATITQEGVLTISADAVGYVTVKVAYGNDTASKIVTVSNQPANQDTALAESVGGVKQDVTNGKLIFDDPNQNAIPDDKQGAYTEDRPYYAILNDENGDRITIQDNFIIEFTVSNYVTTAANPKLMISLGNRNEQFYIVYFTDGTAQIQTYTNPSPANNGSYWGEWINSAKFANTFNTGEVHTYKIVCEDGYYKVYVDNNEITGWNHDGAARTLFRSPESMAIGNNIMFATNQNTTCEIYDISVTAVAGKEGKVTTHFADYFEYDEATGSITVKMTEQTTRDSDVYIQAQRLYSYGQKLDDNCVITFDVKFNGNFTDQSLTVKFGTDHALGIAMNGDTIKGEFHHNFVGQSVNKNDVLIDGVLKVKITIIDGEVKAYFVNSQGTVLHTVNESEKNATNNGVMSFSSFNWNNQNNEGTITVSNIVITPTQTTETPVETPETVE